MRTLITVALTTHLVPGTAPIATKLWRELRTTVGNDASAEEVVEKARFLFSAMDAEKVAECLRNIEKVSLALDSLSQVDVRCVTEFDNEYPLRWIKALSGKHPAAVFASGNLDLLNGEGVGIVGSREVDSIGSQFARQVAQESVRLGYAVISGGAKGVDGIAVEAALSSGGMAIEIVPDSLMKRIQAGLAGPNRTIVSPYHPDAGFSAGNAMGRNKLIYALSQATVVVASSLGSGGTWSGAREAILQRLCPVLVRSAEDAPVGNRALIELGGRALVRVDELDSLLKLEERQTLF